MVGAWALLSPALAKGLLVGIAETCPDNGSTLVPTDYANAVRQAGDIPVVICRTARPEDFDRVLAPLDLLLMPGGEDVAPWRFGEEPSPALGKVNAVRDEFEFALLRAAVRRELPIVGACRGVQLGNVFFGGTLHQDLPSELGANYTVEHRTKGVPERYHAITIAPGSRLAAACGLTSSVVNTRHHQAVKGLAPGFRVSAWTADGVVEAIEADWYPVAGVQFHPESLAARDGEAAWTRFYAHLADFAGTRPTLPCAHRPIGVFDSGVGGLSVLEKLLTLDAFDNATGEEKPDGKPDFADEDFVYFGDQGNMPYGRYDAAGKADFLRELVVRDAQFVLGGEGHAPSKAVVIACNTATAYGLETLQAMPRPHDAAVIGVVPSGAEAAYAALKNEKGRFAVGVMATPATIASGAYERALRRRFGAELEIAVRGGIGLADAVENAEPGVADCARTNLVALVADYRARGGTAPIKAIVLGCTHYPFVLDVFEKTIAELKADPTYAPLIADDLLFIDPAVHTAAECYRSLRRAGRLRPADAPKGARRVTAFFSVGRDGPLSDTVKYGRELHCRDLGTKIVPVAEAGLSAGVRASIQRFFPTCHRELGL